MGTGHHLFGPSSLERRFLCPGSADQERDLPEIPSEFAAEGTRLHAEVAAAIDVWVGKETENPPICTEPIARAICYFEKVIEGDEFASMAEVRSAIADGTVKVFTERTLEWSVYGAVHTRGTADVIIVTPKRLIGIDWKFGHREVTAAPSNWQGAAYAYMAMLEFNRESAEFHFFNPVIGQDTSAFFSDKKAIAKSIMQVIRKSAGGALVPGEKQCRYCKAAGHGTCPAALAKVDQTAALPVVLAPRVAWQDKTNEEVIQLLEAANFCRKFYDKAAAELQRRISEQGPIGGYEIKYSSGGRKVSDMVEAFGLLGDSVTNDEFLACSSVSVAKLEAVFCDKLKSAGQVKTVKEAKEIFAERLSTVLVDCPKKVSLVCTK